MRNGPYIMLVAPDDYPGRKYRGRYAYEHHLVWWKETGNLVRPGYVIHHKNENKHDNHIGNLEEKSISRHSRDHAALPEIITLYCAWCEKGFERKARIHRSRLRNGYQHAYCCRSHQVKHQWATGRVGTMQGKAIIPR